MAHYHMRLTPENSIQNDKVICLECGAEMRQLSEDAIYTIDRGYVAFARLYAIHKQGAFFVVRAKENLKFKRLYSSPKDKEAGVKADQVIALVTRKSQKAYPERLRRVSYVDKERKKHLVFLTNNFDIPAKTVADIYKQRWGVELFFKWIKQHLRIKSFYGTSMNAVKSQIWVGLCIYLLVAIAKKRLGIQCSLYTLLQILEVNIFEKKSIPMLVAEAFKQSFETHVVGKRQVIKDRYPVRILKVSGHPRESKVVDLSECKPFKKSDAS